MVNWTHIVVQVFYVDFGNKEFVSDISIRNIDPQFLHLPFQALECFLVDIEPVGGRDCFSQEARYVLSDSWIWLDIDFVIP